MHKCLSLRQEKDEAIASARTTLHGIAEGFTGENHLTRPLLGKKLLKYYFPAKQLLPDFRIDEYYRMQAKRFSPREPSPVIQELSRTVDLCNSKLSSVYNLLSKVDKETLEGNPTLQDLYGLYSTLSDKYPFNFEMDPRMYQPTGFTWSSSQVQSLKVAAAVSESDTPLEQEPVKPDKRLDDYLSKRCRFMDPLFRRRRLSYIDKIARNKLRKPKTRKLLGRALFAHPDSRESFPDNFGSITVKWPSPFH